MDDIKKEQTLSPVPQKPFEPARYLFLDALKLAMDGARITRLEWQDTNVYGVLRFDEYYKTKILMLHKDNDKFDIWVVSEEDMLGDDFVVIPEGN